MAVTTSPCTSVEERVMQSVESALDTFFIMIDRNPFETDQLVEQIRLAVRAALAVRE
jgi:hypothetical protein